MRYVVLIRLFQLQVEHPMEDLLRKLCDQVVEFGPINESIHKINEHVDISTIDKLKDIYKLTLTKALT